MHNIHFTWFTFDHSRAKSQNHFFVFFFFTLYFGITVRLLQNPFTKFCRFLVNIAFFIVPWEIVNELYSGGNRTQPNRSQFHKLFNSKIRKLNTTKQSQRSVGTRTTRTRTLSTTFQLWLNQHIARDNNAKTTKWRWSGENACGMLAVRRLKTATRIGMDSVWMSHSQHTQKTYVHGICEIIQSAHRV